MMRMDVVEELSCRSDNTLMEASTARLSGVLVVVEWVKKVVERIYELPAVVPSPVSSKGVRNLRETQVANTFKELGDTPVNI